MEPVEFRSCTSRETLHIAQELIDVYEHVYAGPPYAEDPFFSVPSFAERLTRATAMAGFELVTSRVRGRLVGYVHGVTLPSRQEWWLGLEKRPAVLKRSAEAGQIFWLRELMVLPEHAGNRIGRRLHDSIVAGRAEGRTVLTCIAGNEPAYSAYLRWGYRVLGRIKHGADSPEYEAMIQPL